MLPFVASFDDMLLAWLPTHGCHVLPTLRALGARHAHSLSSMAFVSSCTRGTGISLEALPCRPLLQSYARPPSTLPPALPPFQEEQSHLREEVSRQAAAMEQLAENAGRALEARDEAWQELQRVKLMLAGGAAGSPGPSPGAAAAAAAAIMGSPTPAVAAATKFLADATRAGSPGGGRLGAGGMGDPLEASSGMVIVETHLVPKTVNAIPDALPKPVASEVLRKGATDPGPHGSYGGGDEDGAGMYGGGGLGGYGGGGVRGLARAREFSSDGVRGDNPFGQMYGYEEVS